MDEYLPPVVTKLKADLSDFLAGIAEARVAMKAFAQGVKEDMLDASRSAGSLSGMALVTEMRTVIKQQTETLGEEMAENFQEKIIPKMAKGGADAGMGFMQAFTKIGMPLLIAAIVAATPGIAAAIAGAIQLGLGMGFIGLGAFMLRNEPVLIEAANKLKERITKVFSTASAPMLGPLVTALDILGRSFERMAPNINKAFAALAPAIGPLALGLAKMMENMSPGFTDMLVKAGPLLEEFALQLPGIGTALGEFFQMIADHSPEIRAFIGDMGRVVPAIVRGLGMALGFLIGIYGIVSKVHATMREAGWETPLHGYVTTLKAAWKWMEETDPKIKKWFGDRVEDVKRWAGDTSEDIKKFTDDLGVWFSELPGKVGTWLSELPSKVGEIATRAVDTLLFAWGFGLTTLAALWVGWVISLPGRLKAAWDVFYNWMRGNVETFINGWASMPERVGIYYSVMWNSVKTISTTAWNAFYGWMRNNIEIFINGWASMPERIGSFFTRLWVWLNGFAADMRSWGFRVGKALIEGLVEGYGAYLNWAIGKIKSGLESLKRGAREALGLASPSKVFAEMGRYTVQGYIQGVESERDALARTMRIFGAGVPTNGEAGAVGVAAAALQPRGGDGAAAGDRPILVQLLLDGGVLVEKLIEPAQRRKMRTGLTGLA